MTNDNSQSRNKSQKNFVVDLDGTLIKNDLLLEALTDILCRNPLRIFRVFSWLIKGKAFLKEQVAKNYEIEAKTLPYSSEVIDLINKKIQQGYNIILATASPKIYATEIANHLGFFSEVFASERGINLRSHDKKDCLVKKYGAKNFEYIGNSKDDLAIWQFAKKIYAVDPNRSLQSKINSIKAPTQIIKSKKQPLKTFFKAIRIHQWVKNFLIFVPLVASHKINDLQFVSDGILAFIFFSLCASHVYLFNDVLDVKNDRSHKVKKFRAVAAGLIPSHIAVIISIALLVFSLVGAFSFLPFRFGLSVLFYYALTLSYSVLLKRIAMLDIVTLASLYTMRIIAGSYAFDLGITFWMLAFSMFIFLSLSLVKRYAELYQQRSVGKTEKAKGRGYYPGDLEIIASLGASSGYLSVMVLALYIQDSATAALYSHPKFIWFACPILLYWISRVWILTHRGEMNEDPVVFAIKDKVSWLAGLAFVVIFGCAL